jgi:hypothetical protein
MANLQLINNPLQKTVLHPPRVPRSLNLPNHISGLRLGNIILNYFPRIGVLKSVFRAICRRITLPYNNFVQLKFHFSVPVISQQKYLAASACWEIALAHHAGNGNAKKEIQS